MSITVFIEEQHVDEETPTVTLAANSMLAGSTWNGPGPLIQSGARQKCMVRGGRLVDLLRSMEPELLRGRNQVGCPGGECRRVSRGELGQNQARRITRGQSRPELQGHQSRDGLEESGSGESFA